VTLRKTLLGSWLAGYLALAALPCEGLDAFDADDGPLPLADRLRRHRSESAGHEARGEWAAAANHAAHACRVAINLTWTPWDEDCDRAVALSRRAGRPDLEALTLAFSSALAGMGDDWSTALALADRAAALVPDDERLPAVRQVLFVRAGRATETGDFATSERLLERVLSASVAVGDAESESQALAWLGRAALFSGDSARARELARRALDVARRSGNLAQEMVAQWTLGLTELEAGRAAASMPPHEAAAALARRLGLAGYPTVMELNLAEASIALGELPRAEELLRSVRADLEAGLAAPDWLAFAQEVEGRLRLARGDSTGARVLFEKVVDAPAYWLRLRGLLGIARAWAAMPGETERAIAAYERAVGAVEAERWGTPVSGERRSSFLARNATPTRELVELLWERRGEAAAQQILTALEAMRGRAFEDAAWLAKSPGEPAANSGSAAGRPERSPLVDVRKALGPDDLLVEYLLGERFALAVVVDRDGVSLVELARADEVRDLERRAGHFAQRVEESTAGLTPGAAGRALAGRLLDPVLRRRNRATAPTRLWIVPDGGLHGVPFAALSLAEGAYLAERTEIGVLPTAEFLSAPLPDDLPDDSGSTGPGSRRSNVLAVAATLPWSRREAQRAASALSDGILLDGARATATALVESLARRPRVLHFAGHATWDPLVPERSALWLASEGSNSSSPLPVSAVYAWPQAPELVVLSACESARQMTSGGEGVHGLARAFLHAGSRQVVATLWPVRDRSSYEWMSDFYRELANGSPVTRALAEAQRAAIAAGRPPSTWAAYVALGDPRFAWASPPAAGGGRRAWAEAWPQAWGFALLMAGVAAVGWALRRRRRGWNGPD
jgi:CHAT domain-containing protein